MPKGKPLSAAHKAAISRALKGRRRGPMSSATKAKISAALKGKKRGRRGPMSAATKAKISASLKRHYRAKPRKTSKLRTTRGAAGVRTGRLKTGAVRRRPGIRIRPVSPRTSKRWARRGVRKALLSAHTPTHRTGFLKFGRRKKRSEIVIRRTVKAHRVWRRRKTTRKRRRKRRR